MEQAVHDFLHHLQVVRNCSPETIRSYRNHLAKALAAFRLLLQQEAAWPPEQLTPALLRQYLARLCGVERFGARSIALNLAALRSWCGWMVKQGLIAVNPAVGLRGPRIVKSLPRCLSYDDVTRLLSMPDTKSALGSRDVAMLETLYSAGLRLAELTGLDLHDLDLTGGWVKVRGKGRRERLAVLGPPAIDALSWWMVWRNQMAGRITVDPAAVFVNACGERITPRSVSRHLKAYAEAAKLNPRVSPHWLRHAFASHQLANGASLPAIKDLLGHRALSTTTIYAHVSKPKLRQVFDDCHPRA